jgi:hypothetical protein
MTNGNPAMRATTSALSMGNPVSTATEDLTDLHSINQNTTASERYPRSGRAFPMKRHSVLGLVFCALALTACGTPSQHSYNPDYGPDHPINHPMCGGMAYHCLMHIAGGPAGGG